MVGGFRTGAEGGMWREWKALGGAPPALEAQRARLRAVVNGPAAEEWTEF